MPDRGCKMNQSTSNNSGNGGICPEFEFINIATAKSMRC